METHPLAAWIAPQPMTFEQAADMLGCHRVTLHRYASGKKMPKPAMCLRIERLTGGVVTASDLARSYVGAAA
jgi:DNA-binding transcriptional regulator YdaS (Cro superfamily)